MLGIMDTPEEDPKPITPFKEICVVVLCSGLAIFCLWSGIAGLMSGKIAMIKKGAEHLIFRQETPGWFWFWIVAHFIFAALLFTPVYLALASRIRRR